MRRRFFTENKQTKFDYNNYLTIEALEDNVEVILPQAAIEYGIDGYGWKYYEGSIFLSNGQLLSLRNNIIYVTHGTIKINGKCNLCGNCMSLFYKDGAKDKTIMKGSLMNLFANCDGIQNVSSDFLPATTLTDSCYNGMFSNCTSLTSAPELPATTMKKHCYEHMFHGCTGLTSAPELPATTLANYCYKGMFYSCTSLTTAPELPATTLKENCYEEMFAWCYKLKYIKMLATNISAKHCLDSWVNAISSTGTFVKNPEATWDVVGISGVPRGWTVKFDGEEEGLEFPIHLTSGDNGGLGVQVFDWLVEKISSSNEIDSYTLSEEETLYINGYQVKNAVQYYEGDVLFELFERPANLLSVGLSNDGFVLWYLD